MKKDDILIIRLVSVAVLLAALALIILFGVKYKYTGGMAYEINYCYRKF